MAAAYAVLAGWLFAPELIRGQVLFFRDITYTYFPNYVFLEGALRRGIWPLWNPLVDGGAAFLAAYPLDVLLTAGLGARGALALGPPLHVWIAMMGARALARHLGIGGLGALTAGALYGLSGFLLSCVNLLPLFHACALAPLLALAALRLAERPTPERSGVLAIVLALQLCTLAGEIVLQTLLLTLVLWPRPTKRSAWIALAVAALLALAMLSPVLFWMADNIGDTARGHGLDRASALADAVSAPILCEALLPRFFGDVHAFGEANFWGQRHFTGGFPYLLSLYLGPIVCMLSARSGQRRLLLVALLGVLLALGSAGPLAWVLTPFAGIFRAPIKFLFLPTLALCLAAGAGTGIVSGRLRLLWLVPGAGLLAASGLASNTPSALAFLATPFLDAHDAPRALDVIARQWPLVLLSTGGLTLGAGLALAGTLRLRPLAGLLAVLDLAIVNEGINESAPAAYYQLHPSTQRLLDVVRERGPGRVFSFGANVSRLSWAPAVVKRDSDLWLYYLDRQALTPRTHVLDGLDGALDEDRGGWAPEGSTLHPSLRTPAQLGSIAETLRWAGVRYVFSFAPLPAELASPLGQSYLPQVAEPLRLYELVEHLPPAFYVAAPRMSLDEGGAPRLVVERADAKVKPAGAIRIEIRRPHPHALDIGLDTPPGFVVVLDGFHRSWRLDGPAGPAPILRANRRAWAFATPGGAAEFKAHFEPSWRGPALCLSAVGTVLAMGLALTRCFLTVPQAGG